MFYCGNIFSATKEGLIVHSKFIKIIKNKCYQEKLSIEEDYRKSHYI